MAIPRPQTRLDWAGTIFLIVAAITFAVIWSSIGPSKEERRADRQQARASASARAATTASSTSSTAAASSSPSSSSSSSSGASSSTTSASSSASVGANERPLVPGPTVAATKLAKPPTIDGRAAGDDWADVKAFASNALVGGEGKVKVSGSWRVGWDKANLYILAAVTDPALTQTHTLRPHLIGTGDAVGIELGDYREAIRTDKYAGHEVRAWMGPLETGGVIRALLTTRGDSFVPGPAFTAGDVAVRRTGQGYVVEAALPWSALGQGGAKAGDRFAANFLLADAVSSGGDRGKPSTLMSNNEGRSGNALRDRFTWGVLELAD